MANLLGTRKDGKETPFSFVEFLPPFPVRPNAVKVEVPKPRDQSVEEMEHFFKLMVDHNHAFMAERGIGPSEEAN